MIAELRFPASPARGGDRSRRWARAFAADAGPFTRPQTIALLLGFAALVILRLPQAWLHGRFFGEEGAIFFAYAWYRPATVALFRAFGGYLNLAANAITLLDARLVRWGVIPLEHAPYLTMVAALLVQLLPAILLLTGRASWLVRRWALSVSLLLVGMTSWTEEVFLNVLHIQFHLALCVALILAFDVPCTRIARVGYSLLLFLAPLCGPSSIVLLPLFAARSLTNRSWPRAGQTAVFATGVAVQLLLFFTASPARGQLLDGRTLSAMLFVRLVLMPFFGPPVANVIGQGVYASHGAGGLGWWSAAAAAVVWFGTLIALALRRWRQPAIWLILSGLAIAVVSFGGGMIAGDPREWFSVGSGERYMFLPRVLLGLGLVALAEQSAGRFRRFCIALCLVSLAWGAIFYPMPLASLARGPDWAGEVARWRRDHNYRMVSWPTKWTVDLSDRDRRCAPPQWGVAPPPEPSYCESSWLSLVAATPPKDRSLR